MNAKRKQLVLLVEDEKAMANVIQRYLSEEPIEIHHVETGRDAISFLNEALPQVVLLDLSLPDMNGMEVLKYIIDNQFSASVIIITAHGSVEIAVEAMNSGAFDFLEKPFGGDRLLVTLRNALERERLSEIVDTFKSFNRVNYYGFTGSSIAMQSIYGIIDSAAQSKATIFVMGESGTGKELCAQAIHQSSPRSGQPFIPINCASIPKDLMESEMFGHVRGAFTGAAKDRQGVVSRADKGTLFFDEICEMDIGLQAKLLRFLQTGSFQRLGSDKIDSVDVRIICATNKDPLKYVEEGKFREDLYYRLNVIPIHLPALRERDDDVLEIAKKVLKEISDEEGKEFSAFSKTTEEIFRRYDWPGNVRQLRNVIRNIVVLNNGREISAEMLPTPLNPNGNTKMKDGFLTRHAGVADRKLNENTLDTNRVDANIEPLWKVEKEAIERAIAQCGGNVPQAAALLNVSPSTIYRKKQAWMSEMENPI